MKRPAFIITETILSLVLAASLAATAALAVDIKTNGALLPPEWFHSGTPAASEQTKTPEEPSAEISGEQSTVSTPRKSEPVSAPESSVEAQNSALPKEESSKTEASQESSAPAQVRSNLILTEPKDLKKQPAELEKYIKDYGYDVNSLGFDHLILVATGKDSTAKVYCYQKSSKGYWWSIAGEGKALTDKGFIGKNGADFDIAVNSGKSPLGFYSVGDGFYIGTKPDTTYPLFEITDKIYWVTDPKSKLYNQKTETTQKKDWSTAEHMIAAQDNYQYGLVINFNTYKPSAKLSSAIFMCCGSVPTNGSIAVPKDTMKDILEWLDNDSNTYIFVSP